MEIRVGSRAIQRMEFCMDSSAALHPPRSPRRQACPPRNRILSRVNHIDLRRCAPPAATHAPGLFSPRSGGVSAIRGRESAASLSYLRKRSCFARSGCESEQFAACLWRGHESTLRGPMNDDALPGSKIILYQTEDGRSRVQMSLTNPSSKRPRLNGSSDR